MRYLSKKILGSVLLSILLAFGVVGCGNTTLDNTLKDTQQEDSGTWMNADKEKADDEEFFDVDSVEDESQDYSKYEEKKASRDAGESENSNVTYSDGKSSGQDKYQTNSVPEGKQNPVEPGTIDVDTDKQHTCYLTISCRTILDNMEELTEGKEKLIPSNGVIYAKKKVTFYEGETVFDVLLRETRNNRIHMEYSFNPLFNSNYIEAINNLYEFDCGKNSGWMYNVNGWYPNYGCSRYIVQEGDEIQWNYTCDLGRDLGTSWMDQNG